VSHTTDFLDEIAHRNGIRPTSYAIAKHMKEKYGWTRQTVQNYRKGTTVPDDTKALDIAAECELGQRPAPIASRTPSGAQCARGA